MLFRSKLPDETSQNGKKRTLSINELQKFNRYSKYISDPETILSDIEEKGYLPNEGYEVLTQVYPYFHKQIKTKLIESLGEAEKNNVILDNSRRLWIDRLLGAKPDNGMDLKKIQEAYATQKKTAAPTGRITKEAKREAVPSQEVP